MEQTFLHLHRLWKTLNAINVNDSISIRYFCVNWNWISIIKFHFRNARSTLKSASNFNLDSNFRIFISFVTSPARTKLRNRPCLDPHISIYKAIACSGHGTSRTRVRKIRCFSSFLFCYTLVMSPALSYLPVQIFMFRWERNDVFFTSIFLDYYVYLFFLSRIHAHLSDGFYCLILLLIFFFHFSISGLSFYPYFPCSFIYLLIFCCHFLHLKTWKSYKWSSV